MSQKQGEDQIYISYEKSQHRRVGEGLSLLSSATFKLGSVYSLLAPTIWVKLSQLHNLSEPDVFCKTGFKNVCCLVFAVFTRSV